MQELIQKDLDGKSRVKVIELIWVVQDPGPFFIIQIRYSFILITLHSGACSASPDIHVHDRAECFYTRQDIGLLHACGHWQIPLPQGLLLPWLVFEPW